MKSYIQASDTDPYFEGGSPRAEKIKLWIEFTAVKKLECFSFNDTFKYSSDSLYLMKFFFFLAYEKYAIYITCI